MSENYYIALENPISMDFSTLLLRYMTGRACLAECLKYDPKKRTKIHLIPRPGRSGIFSYRLRGHPAWTPRQA